MIFFHFVTKHSFLRVGVARVTKFLLFCKNATTSSRTGVGFPLRVRLHASTSRVHGEQYKPTQLIDHLIIRVLVHSLASFVWLLKCNMKLIHGVPPLPPKAKAFKYPPSLFDLSHFTIFFIEMYAGAHHPRDDLTNSWPWADCTYPSTWHVFVCGIIWIHR